MKKIFKINGLDCPNCAKMLETKIGELKSIDSCEIDFLKSTLALDCKNPDATISEVILLAKKVEPEAEIVVEKENKKSKKNLVLDIALLFIGLCVGLVDILAPLPTWLTWVLFGMSAILMGYKTFYKAYQLLLKKTINENFLVTVSVIGAGLVGERMDALMVILLYSIGKILESLALDKSRKSIEELTNLKPEKVTRLNGEEEEIVTPNDIKLNDIIIVRPGEKVAIDGVVIEGTASIDVQSLTGESLPQTVKKGMEILSGSIVLDSVLKIKATSIYENSTVHKILDLIENASDKKSKTETVISKMSKWYTLGVVALAFVVWGIVWAITKDINTAIYRGLIFLVVSCPCAFAISVPLAYFSGIGNASKKGILIKGSNYLDATASLSTIAFDKTGTITTGEFKITKINNLSKDKTDEEIVYLSALGEQYSLHPIAKAIVKANEKKLQHIKDVREESGKGVYYNYKDNSYFIGRKTTKNDSTSVELYENDKKIAEILLEDEIKETAKTACLELKNMNIKTIMLSGDNDKIVQRVAEKVGIDKAYSKCLPQDKFNYIEKEKENSKIGYVGDGINDAPALTLSDVGFSMGLNGSSASIEASDIVLANDNPLKIVESIKISRFTKKIVWQNIILSAGIKIIFLTLGALGITGMLSAVIADVGVTLVAILNSLRALKYDIKKK